MKDKTLIVKKKNVYGNELIYPVCQDAILFSCIAGTKTFCSTTIANIKKLGYKFETQAPSRKLQAEKFLTPTKSYDKR